MKMFTKLALVSSMAVSANAMAMQSMDDAALSAATGQDGINIGIGISKIEIDKVLIHDNDGLRYSGAAPSAPVAPVLYVASDPEVGTVVNGHTVAVGDLKTPGVPAGAGYGGTASPTTARAGAIVIKADGKTNSATKDHGIVITANPTALLDSHNLADLVIDTEAGASGGNTAFLNVAAKVSGLNIAIGEVGVAASNAKPTTSATSIRRGATDTAWTSSNTTGNYNKILSGLTLKTGQMDANIQLGAAPQGAMIVLSTIMKGGLEIKDLGIYDASSKGSLVGFNTTTSGGVTTTTPVTSTTDGEIRLDSIKVADANGLDLTVNARVSVVGEAVAGDNKGYLRIVTGSGSTTPKTDVYISGIHLGSATAGSIGEVEVQGLQTYYTPAAGVYSKGAVITISGH